VTMRLRKHHSGMILACFVDEGRLEGRIPEFSGEVSNALARRIRKLMGGDVELSYPVLGPDKFVVSALKAQVHLQSARRKSLSIGLTPEAIIYEVFKSMSLDPAMAQQNTKLSPVSKGRALSAWLWAQMLGRPQVMIADALNLSPGAVAMMLSRMRRGGLINEEKERLNRILKKLTIPERDSNLTKSDDSEMGPKVVILKRQRR
jgi:DNA-binding MarR family transcriptional regulator